MCFPGTANWKREVVPDHKFDFVDVQDYHNESLGTRLSYSWIYLLLLKSFAVYLSDLYTAITMATTTDYSNGIFKRCSQKGLDNCIVVPFSVGKWIFVGCIIASYVLLAYEAWKAKKIIRSRDISYAFTNVMANDYYSLRSYDHFCFFSEIENTSQKKDDLAFFIFFTFKGWKRLLLADGPRQVINVLTLYALWLSNEGSISQLENYWNTETTFITKTLVGSIIFTVAIFLGSFILLVIAAVAYVPLLCYIQGNLKEYCCHRVDKRIAELMKKKTRQRVREQARMAQKEARGDFSHLKNKKGDLVRNPAPQATLPQIAFDEDASRAPSRMDHTENLKDRTYAPSVMTSEHGGFKGAGAYPEYPPSLDGAAPDYPPPMPMYEQNAFGHYAPHMGPDYGEDAYEAGGMHAGNVYASSVVAPGATSRTHLTEEYSRDHVVHDTHGLSTRHLTPQHQYDDRSSGYSFGLDYYGGANVGEADDVPSPLPTGVSPTHSTRAHRRSRSGAYRPEGVA